jgi:hypothetical protein
MFENVSPAADSTLLLTVTPQSTNVGNTAYFPPLNGLQLVKVMPIVVPLRPSLTPTRQGANLTINWNADAAGYVLESSATVGTGASWAVVPGTPNPIAGAGSVSVTTTVNAQLYRLRK